MSPWLVLGIVLLILALLAVGGAIAARRRMEATSEGFADHLDQANVDLATAHAADRGWEPAALERAARESVAERHPGVELTSLTLVEVVDRPGVEQDVARYRARDAAGRELIVTMVRRAGNWAAETIEG